MIRLRDLLREFEYGEKLWADPSVEAKLRDQFKSFISRIYNGNTEPNTRWENTVFDSLENYLKYAAGPSDLDRGAPPISQYVDELARLKSEFPDILDPRAAKEPPKTLYRGMTLPGDIITAYISRAKKIEQAAIQAGTYSMTGWPIKMIKLHDIRHIIKSRSARGFVSASTEVEAAGSRLWSPAHLSDRWPVITATSYQSIANKTLWNPDFLDLVGGFHENEIWILDTKIPVTDLYIWDPFSDDAASHRYTTDIVGALYTNKNYSRA